MTSCFFKFSALLLSLVCVFHGMAALTVVKSILMEQANFSINSVYNEDGQLTEISFCKFIKINLAFDEFSPDKNHTSMQISCLHKRLPTIAKFTITLYEDNLHNLINSIIYNELLLSEVFKIKSLINRQQIEITTTQTGISLLSELGLKFPKVTFPTKTFLRPLSSESSSRTRNSRVYLNSEDHTN